jgi:hypothetical protein
MSLNYKQKQILNRYQGEYAWGNLPDDVQVKLEALASRKNDENVWSDAERYLQDNYVRLMGRSAAQINKEV